MISDDECEHQGDYTDNDNDDDDDIVDEVDYDVEPMKMLTNMTIKTITMTRTP